MNSYISFLDKSFTWWLGYLLFEGFNPNPLCTDTERNKTHKERQNVHIFVLVLT